MLLRTMLKDKSFLTLGFFSLGKIPREQTARLNTVLLKEAFYYFKTQTFISKEMSVVNV